MKVAKLYLCILFSIAFFLFSACTAKSEPEGMLPFIDVGELRGGRFRSVCISLAGSHFEGIFDMRNNQWIVYPSPDYWILESVEEECMGETPRIEYIGGRDEGIYWVESSDSIAFLDVPSGYFSGFSFSVTTDTLVWNYDAEFLRVANNDGCYAYVSRSNGDYLTDYAYCGFNFAGFVGNVAVEQLAESGRYVVLFRTGESCLLPEEIDFDVNSLAMCETNTAERFTQYTIEDSMGETFLLCVADGSLVSLDRADRYE